MQLHVVLMFIEHPHEYDVGGGGGGGRNKREWSITGQHLNMKFMHFFIHFFFHSLWQSRVEFARNLCKPARKCHTLAIAEGINSTS